MSESRVQLESLKTEWTKCRVYEEQKHSLISDLFRYIETLSEKLVEAENELRDRKYVARLTRSRADEAEMRLQECHNEKARHSFALVLIDGDHLPFRDELIKDGLNGGKRAAAFLLQAVKEELGIQHPLTTHDLQVVIRVYADKQGLAKTYEEMSVITHAAIFEDFISSFNTNDAMCDYVDVGNKKGSSDEKMEAMFRHGLLDVHCNHVLFSGTVNSGCTRLLTPFVAHEEICRQITLLEGPSFSQESVHVKNKFRSVQFCNVFRAQGLENTKNTNSTHARLPTPATDRAPIYEKTLRSTASGPTSRIELPNPIKTTTSKMGKVLQNRQAQRVDAPLQYSSKEYAELKNRKLCNSFYLLGKCSFMDSSGKCQHDHTAELNKKQMMVLRAYARQLPCRLGLGCRDSDCISGHRCTRENCVREKCWFPPDMHNIDTTVVIST